mgnify:CR=1 FL=1
MSRGYEVGIEGLPGPVLPNVYGCSFGITPLVATERCPYCGATAVLECRCEHCGAYPTDRQSLWATQRVCGNRGGVR